MTARHHIFEESTTMVLRDYMKRMDSPDPSQALECLEPDLEFVIALPAGQVRGTSREEFATYIAGREANDRAHHILRYAVDGDLEFAYGIVTEGGHKRGAFISVATVSDGRRMRRYVSFFDPDLALTAEPAVPEA